MMEKKSRKELLEGFKQIKTYMGVVKITNNENGKIFIAAFPNLKNKWFSIQGQLDTEFHVNKELQKDWKEFGAEAFSYEVIEQKETEDVTDVRWEVKQMEKKWILKLQPYGDKGYNKPPKE